MTPSQLHGLNIYLIILQVSGDSCIFIWRLPLYMSRSMRKRCIAKAESRPPPKCLKLVLPQLPEKMVGISVTPRSVDHIIPFDLPDGKGNNDYIGDSDETSNVKVQGYAASELLELESIHEEAGLPEQGLGELRKVVQILLSSFSIFFYIKIMMC